MPIKLLMPQLGESVVEGTVTKWLVREGDAVAREQLVVEVGTDKADSEVPAPVAGTVLKIVAREGRTVKVGELLCEIEERVSAGAGAGGSSPRSAVAPVAERAEVAAAGAERAAVAAAGAERAEVAAAGAKRAEVAAVANGAGAAAERPAPAVTVERVEAVAPDTAPPSEKLPTVQQVAQRRASPVARKLALGHGSAPEHGGKIQPQGIDPELVDLLNSGVLLPIPNVGFGAYRVPPYQPREGDEVVPFNRRRRILAHHMAYSKITAPHVVTVSEVDLFRAAQLREAHKDRYKKEGVPLTMLVFVCQAAVRALREFPTMNARVLEDAYVVLKEVNLGIAVDAREGLIVPNIKRADELSLRGLARAIDEVAQRARVGNITADDLAGSSFSVSNPGLKGNLFGGAIIAQPNVGILRMGKIQKRVVVLENDGQDVLAVHPVMYLALSYDHRIIDGVLGNAFLYRVTEILEKAEFEV